MIKIHEMYKNETGKKPYTGNLNMGDFQFTGNYIEWLESKLEHIYSFITDYHHALDIHQHCGTAANKCLDKIQSNLNHHWVRGATLK